MLMEENFQNQQALLENEDIVVKLRFTVQAKNSAMQQRYTMLTGSSARKLPYTV